MKKVKVILVMSFLMVLFCSMAQAQFRDLPDGSYVEINNGIVTAQFATQQAWNDYGAGNFAIDHFYVQRTNRSSGIRVESAFIAFETSMVDVCGYMSTLLSGERTIIPIVDPDYGPYIYVSADGFAIPRPIGLNQRALTMGLVPSVLVRITGKVVKATTNVSNDQMNFYYIDDGSGLSNDLSGTKGLKVYDDYHSHSLGEQVSITGILSCETFGTSTIPVFYQSYDDYAGNEPRGTTTHTISGTVTADSGVAGKLVKFLTDSKQSSCILDASGVGSYQISLQEGNYVLSAELLGYRTSSRGSTIDQDYSGVDFYLYPMEEKKVVDITLEEYVIRHDGQSTTDGTIIVRDYEGKRYAKEPVTLSVDSGQIVSCDSITDSRGVAHFKLKSSTNPEAGTLTATSGEVKSYGTVHYSNEGEPTATIVRPYFNEEVTGSYEYQIAVGDVDGEVTKSIILIDNVPFSLLVPSEINKDALPVALNTIKIRNGGHSIQAELTVAKADGSTYKVLSNKVLFKVNNEIYFTCDKTNLFIENPENGFHFTGELARGSNWTVEVRGFDLAELDQTPTNSIASKMMSVGTASTGPVVWTSSGTSKNIDLWWDGKTQGILSPGSYDVNLIVGGNVVSNSGFYIGVSHEMGRCLIVATLQMDGYLLQSSTKRCINGVIEACKRQGIRYTLLIDPNVKTIPNKKGLEDYLKSGYKYLYLTCHGESFPKRNGHSYTRLTGFNDAVGIWGTDSWCSDIHVNPAGYFSINKLGISENHYEFVQIDACFSMGSWETEDDISYAQSLGIRADNLNGSTMIGWKNYYNPTAPWNYEMATRIFWRYFGEGYTAYQSINYAKNNVLATGFWQPYLSVYSEYSSMTCWFTPYE